MFFVTARPPRWTPRSILQRAREVLREEDARSLFFRVAGELGYRRAILFVGELESLKGAATAPFDVRFELLRPEAIPDLLTISQFCDEHEAKRRLDAGQLCLLGYADGRPVHCSWLALAGQSVSIDFLRVEAILSPGSAYSYELFVVPALRRVGLGKAAFQERIRLLRELGLERMVSVVVPENRAGLGHTLSAGMRKIGLLRCVRLFGFQRCWIDSEVDPPPLRILRAI
jgi:hypothetical protein